MRRSEACKKGVKSVCSSTCARRLITHLPPRCQSTASRCNNHASSAALTLQATNEVLISASVGGF